MINPLPEFESVKPDYEFSSVVETEGNERVNYMHVMAHGCNLDNLQALIEQHLTVTSKEDIPERYGRNVQYSGNMRGVDYRVLLEWGACPTGDGGEGHNVEVRTPSTIEDRLSPIIEQEMRKYEAEMTAERHRVEEFVRDNYPVPSH